MNLHRFPILPGNADNCGQQICTALSRFSVSFANSIVRCREPAAGRRDGCLLLITLNMRRIPSFSGESKVESVGLREIGGAELDQATTTESCPCCLRAGVTVIFTSWPSAVRKSI